MAIKVTTQITSCMVVIVAEKLSLWPTTHWPLNKLGSATSRSPGQADVVLQEDRHPDGGDQRNQALGVTHRPIGHALNAQP